MDKKNGRYKMRELPTDPKAVISELEFARGSEEAWNNIELSRLLMVAAWCIRFLLPASKAKCKECELCNAEGCEWCKGDLHPIYRVSKPGPEGWGERLISQYCPSCGRKLPNGRLKAYKHIATLEELRAVMSPRLYRFRDDTAARVANERVEALDWAIEFIQKTLTEKKED